MSIRQHVRSAAQEMIDRYGDDALRQVDLRIDELDQHGKEDARKLWLEIRETIRMLCAKKPANGGNGEG